MTIFTRPQWCIEPLRPQPTAAISPGEPAWLLPTDTSSASTCGSGASLSCSAVARTDIVRRSGGREDPKSRTTRVTDVRAVRCS